MYIINFNKLEVKKGVDVFCIEKISNRTVGALLFILDFVLVIPNFYSIFNNIMYIFKNIFFLFLF